jgi:hypothetical protein
MTVAASSYASSTPQLSRHKVTPAGPRGCEQVNGCETFDGRSVETKSTVRGCLFASMLSVDAGAVIQQFIQY